MATREWIRTTRFIRAALKILAAENPMTVRQLFYRLVSAGVIENTRGDYQKSSRMMTKAREDGRCPFEWIVDRSRPTYEANVFTDAAEYAEVVKRGYRKDYWAAQPRHVEVWTEKDAIIGSVEPVTDELGVTIRVARGFFSTTRMHDIAEHLKRIEQEKEIHILYLGDYDPSGLCIENEGESRLLEYMERIGGAGWFELKRVAILREDIARYHLPPLRVKDTDSRARKFKRRHGRECVELDALPPEVLRERLRKAIRAHIDRKLWDRAVWVEQVELSNIAETAGKWFQRTS
jgi:hypothetical protein